MRLYSDGRLQIAIAEDLDRALGADDASFAKDIRINGALAQGRQLLQVHDVVFLAKDVGKTAFGQAAMQRHLAAFKAAHHARTASRPLAFVAAGRSLAHARAHSASNAFLVL